MYVPFPQKVKQSSQFPIDAASQLAGPENISCCLRANLFNKFGAYKIQCHNYKKKIDKSINFWKAGEKRIVSIFRLRRCGKVEVSWDLNEARPEIYT